MPVLQLPSAAFATELNVMIVTNLGFVIARSVKTAFAAAVNQFTTAKIAFVSYVLNVRISNTVGVVTTSIAQDAMIEICLALAVCHCVQPPRFALATTGLPVTHAKEQAIVISVIADAMR